MYVLKPIAFNMWFIFKEKGIVVLFIKNFNAKVDNLFSIMGNSRPGARDTVCLLKVAHLK